MQVVAFRKPSMPQLPPELWLMIAHHLQFGELEKLLGLNRTFYGLVMDHRYREVDLLEAESSCFLRKVEALQSPDLAVRVRSLKLWPYATWNAVNALPVILKPANAISSTRRSPKSIFGAIRPLLSRPSQPPQPMRSRFVPTELGRMASQDKKLAVTDAAYNLVSVEDLIIHWRANCLTEDDPCCPLLAAFLPALGGNLRSVSLDIPLRVLDKFLPPSVSLTSLEELTIRFTVDRGSSGYSDVKPSSMEPLAPFINGLSRTLKSLSVETRGHLCLSTFFNAMGDFPELIAVSVTIPFDLYHIPDPSGLNRLLSHEALRELTIRSSCCCFAPRHPALDVVSEWYKQCFQGISFQALRSLQLGLTYPFKIGPENTTYMKHLSRSLTSLTILDTRLSFIEVTNLLNSFALSTLDSLSLSVTAISPELFDLLASMCRTLDQLVIDTDTIRLVQGDETRTNADHFSAKMDFRKSFEVEKLYDAWRLRDLEIWMLEYGVGRRRQWDLMRTIARNVPSVSSFSGQGHMREDIEYV
ncbi:hypothetical protein FPV67DRAFT_1527883 [Lyophyllum atratum]|nr:hypothetical protein FPV67DRAFT_1527883 [Lyophyllum atratum]